MAGHSSSSGSESDGDVESLVPWWSSEGGRDFTLSHGVRVVWSVSCALFCYMQVGPTSLCGRLENWCSGVGVTYWLQLAGGVGLPDLCAWDSATRVVAVLAVATAAFLADIVIIPPARTCGAIARALWSEARRHYRRHLRRRAKYERRARRAAEHEAFLAKMAEEARKQEIERTLLREALRKKRQRQRAAAKHRRRRARSSSVSGSSEVGASISGEADESCAHTDDAQVSQESIPTESDEEDAARDDGLGAVKAPSEMHDFEDAIEPSIVSQQSRYFGTGEWLLICAVMLVSVTCALEAYQIFLENAGYALTIDRALRTELMLRTGEAMQQTQRERGLYAVFVASGGTQMEAELEVQTLRSNHALGAMAAALDRHMEIDIEAQAVDHADAQAVDAVRVARDQTIEYLAVVPRRRDEFRRRAIDKAAGEAVEFYTSMHDTFIAFMIKLCSPMLSGGAAPRALAPLLFAHINLLMTKEKVGIERAVIAAALAAEPVRNHAEVPTSAMIGVRESMAAQEGYRRMFLSFAPSWAVAMYDAHREKKCVLLALKMRHSLLVWLSSSWFISIEQYCPPRSLSDQQY